jgi:hypothetical protein
VSTSSPGNAARRLRVAQGELGMARVKQVARSSTVGRTPRTELAARAAKAGRGGPLDTNRTYPDIISVVAIPADTQQNFAAIGSGRINNQYFLPPSSLSPLVRAFLVFLGSRDFCYSGGSANRKRLQLFLYQRSHARCADWRRSSV